MPGAFHTATQRLPAHSIRQRVRHNTAPRNLANAFETAIRARKDESLTRRSAEELTKKARVLQAAYGGEGKTFVLSLVDVDLDGFGTKVDSLAELLTKSLDAIKE